MVAMSFVRAPEEVKLAHAVMDEVGKHVPVMVKLEKPEAVSDLAAIVDAFDGLMVARGDLGVETSVELVPVYQKRIIEEANRAEKFVITATQMLQSMINEPRPTRAEASDVANAVWDGSDALMLSGETATGKYPVASVATMARIIESAEAGRASGADAAHKWSGRQSGRTSRALCEAAAFAAEEMNAKLIAVFTESGLMARRLSALRPEQRIVALTPSEEARNELTIIWGVESLLHPPADSTRDLIKVGDRVLLEAGVVQQGQIVVVMAGRLSGLGLSSSMTLHAVGEETIPPQV
jgi:pyruvate kinase